MEPGGAVPVGAFVGVAGEPVQAHRCAEQKDRVAGGQDHLGVHVLSVP
jgi:hypothetical protein